MKVWWLAALPVLPLLLLTVVAWGPAVCWSFLVHKLKLRNPWLEVFLMALVIPIIYASFLLVILLLKII